MASSNLGGSDTPQVPESLLLLEKLAESAPKDNVRLQNLIAGLRQAIQKDRREVDKAQDALNEYAEAYEKLTAPANRLGLFLRNLDAGDIGGSEEEALNLELVLISVGDTEFVSTVDPKIDRSGLVPGARVRVNDAYSVVGILPATDQGMTAKVSETMEDGRLKIGGDAPGQGTRFVYRAEALKETKIKGGDEVRLDPSGRFALEHFGSKESRDYFLEDVPEIPWEKVGGQKDAIALIRETIEQPLLYPEVFEAYGKKPVKGILLYGPPGNGKTLIGKATAHNLAKEYSQRKGTEVKEYFMAISGPKILNMWVGETERMVREIFSTARERAKDGYLVFIFMDEAEAILRTRSSGRYFSMSNTVVPQFCAELDGLQSLDNVVLILTSNRPDYIDPAILRPGRIDRKVKVIRPDKDASTQIAGIYLHAGLPLDPTLIAKYEGEIDCARKELIEGLIEKLWAKTSENEFLKVSLRTGSVETLYRKDMISGALIESIVGRAKEKAIRRTIADSVEGTSAIAKHGITLDDLLESMTEEYRENEIFPKSDQLEDWLQLLDLEPEKVVAVRPVGRNRGEEVVRKSIV